MLVISNLANYSNCRSPGRKGPTHTPAGEKLSSRAVFLWVGPTPGCSLGTECPLCSWWLPPPPLPQETGLTAASWGGGKQKALSRCYRGALSQAQGVMSAQSPLESIPCAMDHCPHPCVLGPGCHRHLDLSVQVSLNQLVPDGLLIPGCVWAQPKWEDVPIAGVMRGPVNLLGISTQWSFDLSLISRICCTMCPLTWLLPSVPPLSPENSDVWP